MPKYLDILLGTQEVCHFVQAALFRGPAAITQKKGGYFLLNL